MVYNMLFVDIEGFVGLIIFNCLEVFNVFNGELMDELIEVIDKLEVDILIGCFVIIGFVKVFVVGVDIKEMQFKFYMDVYKEDFIIVNWECVIWC